MVALTRCWIAKNANRNKNTNMYNWLIMSDSKGQAVIIANSADRDEFESLWSQGDFVGRFDDQ